MKKIEINFVVTGFVGKDAEIRQFTNAIKKLRLSPKNPLLKSWKTGSPLWDLWG